MQTETEQKLQQDNEDESLGTTSELEELGACKRRLKAAVPSAAVTEELERSYQELTKMVQLPGFRKGKVPRSLLESRYGEQIEKDVKESLLERSFVEVSKEKELSVVGSPEFDKVEFKAGADFTYEADFEVRPVFELPQYKGVEVQAEATEVSDEDVAAELENLRKRTASWAPIDPSAAGPEDVYAGVYSLVRGDEKVKEDQKASFRPSTKVLDAFLIDDLAEQVKAWVISPDDPLKLKVTVPDSYGDEVLRGEELGLEFALEEVSRAELPALDDEFAKKLQEDSLEALEKTLRQGLSDRRRDESDRRIEEKVLEKIEAETTVDLPETLVKQQTERARQEREYELMKTGMSPDEAKEKLIAEGESVEEELRQGVKRFFILTEIADKEKVFVTENDIEKRVGELAGLYGAPPAAIREQLRKSGRLESLRGKLLEEKTRAFLRKKAKVLEPAGGEPASEKD